MGDRGSLGIERREGGSLGICVCVVAGRGGL